MSTATVSPDRILKELADLWVSLGKNGEGDASNGVLRACSMTLIVMAEESDDPGDLGETIAALMPEHPARTVMVRLRAGEEQTLSARVFSQCWMPFGQRRQICCEQVEITASDTSLSELPAVIMPLAVPDLPVILWCRSPRLAVMPELEQLAPIADRVILDSTRMGGARSALPWLETLTARGMLIADLAWTQLTRWRETLSRVFENREYLGRMQELSEVQVCYGGDEAIPAAYYLAAWLTDSLAGAGVTAHTKLEQDKNAAAGTIASVNLRGATPEALHVQLLTRGGGLTIRINGLSSCTAMPASGDYARLREELGIVRRDPVFEKTLSSAARLAVSSVIQ